MIEPITGERQCRRCHECKPLSMFPPRKDRPSAGPVCIACRNLAAEKRAEFAWTAVEVDLICRVFPERGSAGCLEFMPNRTASQIASKAQRLGVHYVGPRNSGTPAKEAAWSVPTHDYTAPDYAWRAASMPVFERRAFL